MELEEDGCCSETATLGQENGGQGGYGSRGNSSAAQSGGGGAGNPGGLGATFNNFYRPGSQGWNGIEAAGDDGTGGLLIIYANNIENEENGKILSKGMNGGNAVRSGGASGGGSINIFYKQIYLNNGIISADGGNVNYSVNNGGPGGNGSISVGQLLNGTYTGTYTNY